MSKLFRLKPLRFSIVKRHSPLTDDCTRTVHECWPFAIEKEEEPGDPKKPWSLKWVYSEYYDEGYSSHASFEEAKKVAHRIHLEHALEFVEEVEQ